MSIIKAIKVAVLFIAICMSQLACAYGEYGSAGVGTGEVRRIGNVKMGTVLEIRKVQIKVDSGMVYKATGATVGSAVGGMACKGRDWTIQVICGTIGGVIGGVAANQVGTEIKDGVEMVVLYKDTGELVSVSQESAGTAIPAIGSNVYITTTNGVTRVYPATSATDTASTVAARM